MQNCELCLKGQRKQINEYMNAKYFEAFNFYFAKPINEIIAQIPHAAHVIYFKDYLILDEQMEYMKRFYTKDEIKPRVDILTEFYVQNYKHLHPNVVVTDAFKIMSKRNNKYDKLFYQKAQQEHQTIQEEQFISRQVLNSKLTLNSQISFETQEHDIYEDNNKSGVKQQIDFKGLEIIKNQNENNNSELKDDEEINAQLNECVTQVNQQYAKKKKQSIYLQNSQSNKSLKRRNHNGESQDKKISNSKSESKQQSSLKQTKNYEDQQIELGIGIEQFNDIDIKPKLTRMQSDSQTIQKMLREYQNMQKIRSLKSAMSSDILPVSTSVQGFQGQQKSIRQDHNNNGSMHSSTSTKQETLKKVYQPLPKKITTTQLDKIARGGCLTDRTYKKPPPISEDLMMKIHDQMRGLNTEKQKVEFKYMIPSQYNTSQNQKITSNKAKSSNSKKIISELGTKSQHVGPKTQQQVINSQRTDEIVKKYIQFASQTIKKKFDFKLNLQGLNSYGVQEDPQEEDTSSKRNNFFTERHSQLQDKEQFNSHRKILQK